VDAAGLGLFATYAAQTLLGLVLAGIFAHFRTTYRREYLRDWCWAYVAGCLYFVTAANATYLVQTGAPMADRLGWSLASQVAAYCQIALLIRGALGVGANAAATSNRWTWIAIAAVLGGVLTLAYAFTPPAVSERLVLRVGLRYALSGLAFLGVAFILLRRIGTAAGAGARLTATGFATYGLLQLFGLGVFVWQVTYRQRIPGAEFLGVFDLVAQAAIGLALVIWVADEERRRADVASAQADRVTKFDPSTGFPNRTHALSLLAGVIEQEAESARPVAVLVIDVPDLDRIRTSNGAGSAEQVAIEIARQLEHGLARSSPGLARIESRRFMAWVRWEMRVDRVTAAVDALLDELEAPRPVGDQRLSLRVRVGIALSGPSTASSAAQADALLRQAELAAEVTDGRISYHAPELDAQARRHMARIAEVEAALAGGEFIANYQPVVAARTHEVTGFELLARWRRPGGSLSLPAEFLPVMDERGLTVTLDRQLLREGCAWLSGQLQASGCTLSVNVSARAFDRGEDVDYILRAIEACGVAPARLQDRGHRIARAARSGAHAQIAEAFARRRRPRRSRRLRHRVLVPVALARSAGRRDQDRSQLRGDRRGRAAIARDRRGHHRACAQSRPRRRCRRRRERSAGGASRSGRRDPLAGLPFRTRGGTGSGGALVRTAAADRLAVAELVNARARCAARGHRIRSRQPSHPPSTEPGERRDDRQRDPPGVSSARADEHQQRPAEIREHDRAHDEGLERGLPRTDRQAQEHARECPAEHGCQVPRRPEDPDVTFTQRRRGLRRNEPAVAEVPKDEHFAQDRMDGTRHECERTGEQEECRHFDPVQGGVRLE
jgi:GGDEF domain-containing protein